MSVDAKVFVGIVWGHCLKPLFEGIIAIVLYDCEVVHGVLKTGCVYWKSNASKQSLTKTVFKTMSNDIVKEMLGNRKEN